MDCAETDEKKDQPAVKTTVTSLWEQRFQVRIVLAGIVLLSGLERLGYRRVLFL